MWKLPKSTLKMDGVMMMISDASSEAFGAHVYIVLVSVLFVDINFVASCQPIIKKNKTPMHAHGFSPAP